MTLRDRKFLKISIVLGALVTGAGLAQASPDLTERNSATRTDTALTTGQAPAQASDWPPPVTAAPKKEPVVSAPQKEPVREAKLQPATEVKSDVSPPHAERHTERHKRARYADDRDDFRPRSDFRYRDDFRPRVRITEPRPVRFGRGFGFRRRWF